MTRRELLATPLSLARTGQFIKGICGGIFPAAMPLEEQFKQAKNAGFDAIEFRVGGQADITTPPDQARRLAEAARKTGVMIASIWVSEMFSKSPLHHPDPAVRSQGVEGLRKVIGLARALECDAILVVPGRVGSGPKFMYGYQETWDRVSAELRKVVPDAEKARVCITPENVWNKFLVSPLEMRAFVDQFRSPWVQVHFDVGNIMQWGYPQDWILTLGPRIKRVHLKDFKLSDRAEQGRFVDLLEGDVDWKAVMTALKKTGYRGPLCPEYGARPDQPDRLLQISKAVDKILAMA
jgi:L-ribulose-5-phosphate 3-epimerase